LKGIESEFRVRISLDRKGSKDSNATVIGLAPAVQSAIDQMEQTTLAVTEDLKLSDAYINLLLNKQASMAKQLQLAHSTKVDIKKDEGIVQITGLPSRVDETIAAIRSLNATTKRVTVPSPLRRRARALTAPLLTPCAVASSGPTLGSSRCDWHERERDSGSARRVRRDREQRQNL
jgi:hypothetical protein